MKIVFFSCVLFGGLAVSDAAFSAAATPAPVDKSKPPAAATSTPTAKSPSPAPTAATPAGQTTLDGYLAVLTDRLALSKDEQTDIKTYYLDDGAKLQTLLNDATLSPLEQARQVETLRDTRNAKIVALLRNVDRADVFRAVEADYRVALTVLAADGALVPSSPPPAVPQPTQTPPSAADRPK